MELTSFVLISLITYSGIIIGIIIALMAQEELKPGKKYFILLHNITLALILFFFLKSIKINYLLEILLPLIIVLLSFIYIETFKKSYMIYLILGIILALSSKNDNYLLVNSSLIAFYGFIIAALQLNIKQKNYLKIILNNLGFFICLVIFFLL